MGSNNVFIGKDSGYNVTSDRNTLVGNVGQSVASGTVRLCSGGGRDSLRARWDDDGALMLTIPTGWLSFSVDSSNRLIGRVVGKDSTVTEYPIDPVALLSAVSNGC